MGSWLFGKKNTSNIPNYTGLSIQTSVLDTPITIAWGKCKLSPNIIWTNNFQQHTSGGGKGGMVGGKGAKQTTYTTGIIMSLCEGPIQSIAQVWQNNASDSIASLGLTLYTGTITQTPPAFIISNYPTEAFSYPQTAYLYSPSYDLGTSANVPMNWVEAVCYLSGTMPGTVDANPADIITDLLTSTQYGMGLVSGDIDSVSWTQYKTYCQAQGIFFSPVLQGQEKCNQIIDRWATLSNSWIFWSGDAIKFIPLGDSAITANSVTYTPTNPVVYNLTVANFVDLKSPVTVMRKDPADAFNRTVIEISDRTMQYNANPCEYKDQTLIDLYGLRDASSSSASDICDHVVGMTVVALIGKRTAYVRNTYKFKLSYQYVLLEPGDIVTLTDPNNAAINLLPVRIQTVQENSDDTLSFVAEEFTGVVGSIYASAPATSTPTVNNQLISPGDVNPPAVIEPASSLTNGVAQVWIAASGGANWGGAYCYMSLDGGTTYVFAGQITARAKQGVLTANLASHSSPDTVNTLSIDCTESIGIIQPATNADATALRTLSLVVPQPIANAIQTTGELLAYGDVTTTGTYTDDLTYLVRGAYGTAPEAHSTGDQFTLLDLTGASGTTIIYNLPAEYVGQTLYLKFISYNLFGLATQELSGVTAYSYTPIGSGFGSGAGGIPAVPTGLTSTAGNGQNVLTWSPNGATDNVESYTLYAAAGSSQPFSSAVAIYTGLSTTFAHSGIGNSAAYTYFLVATNAIGSSTHTSGVNGTSNAAGFVTALTGLSDVNVTEGMAIDGYLLDYNYGTSKWIALAKAYDIAVNYVGVTVNAEITRINIVRPVTLPASLTGSYATAGTAATASTVFTLKQNTTTIGTITFAISGTTGTFSFTGAVTFSAGDVFKIIAPATADATLADIAFTFKGTW